MNILMVTTNFPRWAKDSRAPFILGLAKSLASKGNQVRVLSMHNPGASLQEELEGVSVRRVRYAADRNETLQKDAAGIPSAWKHGLKSKFLLGWFSLKMWQQLLITSPRAQIIHAHWALSAAIVRLASFKQRTPYVVTVHGSDIYKTTSNPLLRAVVRYGLRGAHKIIAVGKDLAASVIQLGIDPGRVAVVHTGITLEDFPMNPSADRREQILFVGSLIPRKGVNFLIEAMAEIYEHWPAYQLLIVGEGEEEGKLRALTSKLNLEDHVHFLGNQSQAEVSQLMRESKLFVLPSVEEGQGVVLVEAMASGTPCVASAVGGIPDVIAGVGCLVQPGSCADLSRGIGSLLVDDQLWERYQNAGRKRVEEAFSWDVLSESILKIYQEALGKQLLPESRQPEPPL